MILVIIKSLLLIWVVFSLLVFGFQRYLIYLPNKKTPHLSRYDKKYIQELHWINSDKIPLIGFYHPSSIQAPILVFFHGNRGNIGARKVLMHQFMERGYGVYMPEYRGYGGVPGKPSEQGLYEDARSSILHLKSLGIEEKQMIFFGESLGASVALEMALEYSVSGLILQSPFLSLSSMAHLHYPWNFLPVLDHYNNQEKIQKITCALFILHGTHDEVVPVEQGKILFSKANLVASKRMVLFNGQSHSILWDEHFFQHIRDYIEQDIHYGHASRLHEINNR